MGIGVRSGGSPRTRTNARSHTHCSGAHNAAAAPSPSAAAASRRQTRARHRLCPLPSACAARLPAPQKFPGSFACPRSRVVPLPGTAESERLDEDPCRALPGAGAWSGPCCPLEGAGRARGSPGTWRPRGRAPAGLASIPRPAGRSSSPTVSRPAAHSRHDSAELVLLLPGAMGQVPLLLPPAPALLPPQPGNRRLPPAPCKPPAPTLRTPAPSPGPAEPPDLSPTLRNTSSWL